MEHQGPRRNLTTSHWTVGNIAKGIIKMKTKGKKVQNMMTKNTGSKKLKTENVIFTKTNVQYSGNDLARTSNDFD